VTLESGRGRVTDLGSTTGIYVNGEHLMREVRQLRSGDSLAIGGEIIYFLSAAEAVLPPVEVPQPSSRLAMDREELSIGRDQGNDIVLDHPRVSPRHAVIASGAHGARIKDVSHGGDGLRINGNTVTRSFLVTGDEIAIGPFRFIFDGELLQQRTVGQGLRLDAEQIAYNVGAKTILHPLSVTILPGEFVGIIGPSGAGKSTLLKALCGVQRVSGGSVAIDGEPVRSRAADLGYVPQDEIVHPLLSVREALEYAADLRLPQDTRPAERQEAVQRALREVDLVEHADKPIKALSGGQRKRVGVATELISQPGMLFLDEPTSGLDPGLEQLLMQLFRELANGGRATAIVTHATRSLRQCDRVIVMGEGGHLCFAGSPEQALAFFDVEDFDDIYTALSQQGAAHWADLHRGATTAARPGVSTVRRELRASRRVGPQTAVLVRRRFKVFMRDHRNLKILGIQVPVIALLLAFLFHSTVFRLFEPGYSGQSAELLFLLVTVALWFGSLVSAREIVKERSLMARELAVGVRIPSYLLSKAIVLGSITGLQTVVTAVIVFALRPLHEPTSTVGLEILVLVLASWAGVAMGLLVSVSVDSEDQAASFVPLLLIPQLLFGGTIVPVHQMGLPVQILSKGIVSQWAFSGLGNGIHLNARISDDPVFRTVSHYGHNFFATPASVSVLAIIGFMGVCVTVLWLRLASAQRA
jgi:ABC-type multidrug transport system ATPase subunit